ncbi:MAG TPA: GDSL-type esterase/lipase family protein [Bacteroidia bacterium]|nr:GDSL-type esterase/lipase family protein [Bacteroidia bacterium]
MTIIRNRINSNFILFILLGMLLWANILRAQTLDSTAYAAYKFIKVKENKIQNDSAALALFYEKLYQLKETKSGRVNVVHIGDSHIQADFFSGSVRQKLQLKFGNAGRGLIFPYRVAKSNEPLTYRTESRSNWNSKRNVFYDNPLPIGITGFTVETGDSSAEIDVTVKDQPGLGYSFSKLTLFHEKEQKNYDITVCDESNCERGVLRSADKNANPFVSELKLDKPMEQFILRNKQTDTAVQHSTRIYGILLENDSAGVLYNMIGVNGSEYRHYNMSKHFTSQLSYLNADLIILSLGTNEAFSMGFDRVKFNNNIDTLVMNLKLTNPNAAILLTTPGDSYRKSRKGRVKNPDMKIARVTIINYCVQHNLAYWDWFEIMGGYGSMNNWLLARLAQKDRVHYNGRGYMIQGDLLYRAILNGYNNYVHTKKETATHR